MKKGIVSTNCKSLLIIKKGSKIQLYGGKALKLGSTSCMVFEWFATNAKNVKVEMRRDNLLS